LQYYSTWPYSKMEKRGQGLKEVPFFSLREAKS
jgi:hypothetical protein